MNFTLCCKELCVLRFQGAQRVISSLKIGNKTFTEMIDFVMKRQRAKPYKTVTLEVSQKEYLQRIGLSNKYCSILFQTALRCSCKEQGY
jgi:hypothetical protein